MAVGVQQQQRRGTEAEWLASGKILAAGEIGFATDSKVIKMGDGVNTWDNLSIPYDGRYLPINGKAADSEMLDGISSGGFLLVGDASTSATADKVAKRDGAGRMKAVAGATGDDVVNYDQMVAADSQLAISRTETANFTLAVADAGKMIFANGTSYSTTIVCTLPTNASVPIPIGSVIEIRTFAGSKSPVSISPASGVTLAGASLTYGDGSVIRILKNGTDSWVTLSVIHSPGPVLRRKIKAGADNTCPPGFTKLRLDGANSGTALFSNNADTLGVDQQWSSADNYKAFCRRSGWYDVKAAITFWEDFDSRIYVKLRVNDIQQNLGAGVWRSEVDTGVSMSAYIPLNVGDYVEVYAYQGTHVGAQITDTNDSHSAFEWAWRRPL